MRGLRPLEAVSCTQEVKHCTFEQSHVHEKPFHCRMICGTRLKHSDALPFPHMSQKLEAT